jgi:hypothetical protein
MYLLDELVQLELHPALELLLLLVSAMMLIMIR